MNIKKFFKLAKNASTFSDCPRVHIGAIIVEKNKVISVGWNQTKETRMQKLYNKNRNFDPEKSKNSSHAEMNALEKILKSRHSIDFSRCSIFVYRELKKDGSLALARPCPACEAALRDAGIMDIYYTGVNSFIHETYYEENSIKEILE